VSGKILVDLFMAADGSSFAIRQIVEPSVQLPGQRAYNYAWYTSYPDASPQLAAVMIDSDGHRHRWTVPPGKLSPAVWDCQLALVESVLPAPFSKLVRKTY
jgi:hypothetical protein